MDYKNQAKKGGPLVPEGKGARTGMIATAGFQFVLKIGRHDVPRRANFYGWIKLRHPVPPRRILEVRKRALLDDTVTLAPLRIFGSP